MHPVGYGEIGVERGFVAIDTREVAQCPCAELHGATVLPCESVGFLLGEKISTFCNNISGSTVGAVLPRQDSPFGFQDNPRVAGVVGLIVVDAIGFVRGIEVGTAIIGILAVDSHHVALIESTCGVVAGTRGESIGNAGAEVDSTADERLLLVGDFREAVDIVGASREQEECR